MIDTPRKSRFLLVLEGARENETAHLHTLRFLLKHLLRARGLRCIEAREVCDEEKERGSVKR
jgi:hypothetical protein